MNSINIFFKLLKANLKRLKKYILPVLASIMILLLICGGAGIFISNNLYKEGISKTVSIAYYLPQDEDYRFNNFGLNIIKDLEGTKEVVDLIEVTSIEEGYELLENGEVLYYIIVPEMFFSGIMDSTNPELTILFADNSDITSYISNELFTAYARYLGTAQAGVYSALDTLRYHDLSSDTIYDLQNTVNMTFLDRALNKDNYLNKMDATGESGYTLFEHYMAVALMLSLFFISFVLMPYLQGYNKGLIIKLNTLKINNFHIFLSNFTATIPILYIAFLPCYIVISIISESINPIGMLLVLPSVILISLIINIVASLCSNEFASNMIILAITLIIAYTGGGILPKAVLPEAIKELSSYLPGEYIISNLTRSLFGM